ncbi:MAG: transposase [Euryarchaeota archaeon]|nr:transposase [Euryarchaeota archaeon]MDE1836191.1 transposase [Euryarchaeota archaeon]MDE1881634.1 transposase [Euryarchaeota archaeon]MDE2045446.1 transposase [Thermoplasmata archaeon]
MTSWAVPVLWAPESTDDEVVVSRRKLGELEKEMERLREKAKKLETESEDLRRQLAVHVNPNVPPSVRNPALGFARARPLVPTEDRRKPGPKPGHPGTTRAPLVPDRKVSLTADTCGHCHGHRLHRTGVDTQQEVELPPPRKAVVTEYDIGVCRCLDCGEEVRATLQSEREPSGYGPQLQTEAVLGKTEERLPYRKLETLFVRQGLPMSLATHQGLVWAASDSLGGTCEEILERVLEATVVYADETSFRVGGEKWWL